MSNYRYLICANITVYAAISGIQAVDSDDAIGFDNAKFYLSLQASDAVKRLLAKQANGKNPVSDKRAEINTVLAMLCASLANSWLTYHRCRAPVCFAGQEDVY